MKFSIKQINNLITGVQLSAELQASMVGYRRFISLAAYTDNGKPNKIITDEKEKSLFFWIKDYEIPSEYIENGWDYCDDILLNSFYTNGIIGITNAEAELLKRTSDLSVFVPTWETDAPD